MKKISFLLFVGFLFCVDLTRAQVSTASKSDKRPKSPPIAKPDSTTKQDSTTKPKPASKTFKLTKVSIVPNTIGNASLSVDFVISLDGNSMDPDYFIDAAHRPKFHITYAGNAPKTCDLHADFAVTAQGVKIKITNFNTETVNRFLNKDNKISLMFDDDLTFGYFGSLPGGAIGKTEQIGLITKEDLNTKIDSNLSYPADEKSKFLTALNNFYYYQNTFDFGVQPSSDSSSTSYTLNFAFQNKYNGSSFLKCPTTGDASKAKPSSFAIYYGVSGRLSTNFKDSLNFIDIYPLIMHGDNYTVIDTAKKDSAKDKPNKLPYEWNVKLGNESNQTFTTKRIALDASLSTIIPNLVNLTSETSQRLRLKPEIDGGIKGYYDYSNSASTFYSGQAYINAYYYIPVYDSYAIIINDKTFYDFSQQKNPHHLISSNYTVEIGTDVPKTGFKVMLKYENGKTDINYKQSQAVVVGLLMNVFNEKTQ